MQLKKDRLSRLGSPANFEFRPLDICQQDVIAELFLEWRPQSVVHLAAQPGVRNSLQNPHACISVNVAGFVHVLEGCRHGNVEHLVYASSSSVYGANTKLPFSETDPVEHPISLYGAAKRADELMAHVYSHLFGLPTTGLRYFTVYGPWGRPDMSPFRFADAILSGKPLELFNQGKHERDFTYIDDAAEATLRALDRPAKRTQAAREAGSPSSDATPFRLFNVGTRQRVTLDRYIEILEGCFGKKALRTMLPKQPGDIETTWSDTRELERELGFAPATPLEKGIGAFADWYLDYYKLRQ